MKVIANRFKIIFPKIIAQEQAGFIIERNITNNIVISQEVIHSMKELQESKVDGDKNLFEKSIWPSVMGFYWCFFSSGRYP